MMTSVQAALSGNSSAAVPDLFDAVKSTANIPTDTRWTAEATALFTRRAADTYAETRKTEFAVRSVEQTSAGAGTAQRDDFGLKSVEQTTASEGAARREVFALPKAALVNPVDWRRGATFYALQEWEGYVDSVEDDEVAVRLVDLTGGAKLASQTARIPLTEFSEDDIQKLMPGAVFRWAIGYQRSRRGTKMRVSNIIFRDLPRWTKSELSEADREAEDLSLFLNSDVAD